MELAVIHCSVIPVRQPISGFPEIGHINWGAKRIGEPGIH
jgi:hypothetical protein